MSVLGTEMPQFGYSDWCPPTHPETKEDILTVLDIQPGSNEFDAAYSFFVGEDPAKRIRFGVYYEEDYYDWFEVIRG
jgi:hypothetical protein